MLFEGTAKYFWMLFGLYLIIVLTVKLCLMHFFKDMKISSYKVFIPFYNRLLLVDKLELNRFVFYMTLVPFANLYYYNIIIQKLLEAYNLDSKESILFIVMPMYKFPEMVFKNPKYMLHMYDETEKFIPNETTLFATEPAVEEVPAEENVEVQPEQKKDNVFSNESLEPDLKKETIVEAKQEEEVVKKPITYDDNRPKVCPKCGTKLEPTADMCFFCGTKIS